VLFEANENTERIKSMFWDNNCLPSFAPKEKLEENSKDMNKKFRIKTSW
jgi:hypothetical protein